MPESKLYEMADRVWPAHGTTSNGLRDRNIEKWVRFIAYLGSKWLLADKVLRK